MLCSRGYNCKSYEKENNERERWLTEDEEKRLPTVEELASLLQPSKDHGKCIDPIFSAGNRQITIWSGDSNNSSESA